MKFLAIVLFILLPGRVLAQCDLTGFTPPMIYDTYHEYYNNETKWAGFNVHDPTVYKDGEYYYEYGTDAALGYDAGSGSLKRRSKDLVNWEFLGRAFNGVPQSAVDFFKLYNPAYKNNGIWAPFLHKYNDEYRLYYSAPGGLEGVNLAFIGYAVSSSADGPWEDRGKITVSIPNDTINAIDPTVVLDQQTGQLWMAYGSYQTGIYCVELNPETGGIKSEGDRGLRIAARASGRHAAIEGPEINYKDGFYYLFVSYDWLGDTYNVRAGRSQKPNGPYLDFNGKDMAAYSDNVPMIQAPYQFNNHPGWIGTGHCSVYNDEGRYYMLNQGRYAISGANMVLHIREMFWIDGWPVLSPERYAAVPNCSITADSLVGNWEHLPLTYTLSATPQSLSHTIELKEGGTITGFANGTWTFDADSRRLQIILGAGKPIDLIVARGWDWENKCSTIIYTGFNTSGQCAWGKKINQKAVDNFTQIIPGATYIIRNHFSNMFMEIPNNAVSVGTSVKQNVETGESTQQWKLLYNNGYYQFAANDNESLVATVANGNSANGTDLFLSENNKGSAQNFKIISNENGYFRVLTKASNLLGCLDDEGFSIVPGGNIFQWEYLGGLNQIWRFERDETVPLDSAEYKESLVVSTADEGHFSTLTIYPNPSNSGNIMIDFGNINMLEITSILLYDNLGRKALSLKQPESATLELSMPPGFYIVKIAMKEGFVTRKLIFQ